jgi:flagellar biosynthesis protein FlhG
VDGSGALIVSCGGGKGGAGKSLVASNLGIALARLGMRTVLVDADLGAANLHTMFGIDQPGATLGALLDRRVRSLEEVAIPTGEPRLFLVPGTGAVVGAANIAHAQKTKLLAHIRRIDADVVVVDVGAGTAFNTLDLFDLGDVRLVVATPQLTSVQNAYGFIKGAVHRSLRAAAHTDEERALLASASDRTETERGGHSVARVEQQNPQLAARMRAMIAGFGGAIVGNQVEGPAQRNVFFALSRMARDFLGVTLPVVAELPLDTDLRRSITTRKPYLYTFSAGPIAKAFGQIAEHVVSANLAEIRSARALVEIDELPAPRDDEHGVDLTSYLRREVRVAVDWPAELRSGGAAFPVRVVDLSPRGALVASKAAIASGARIELRVAYHPDPIVGTVRHVRPGYVGIEFDQAHEVLLSSARR